MLKSLAVCILSIGACSILGASTLYVSKTGQFSNADTAGQLVSPSGTFSLSFVVNSATTPLNGTVDALGFDAPILNFSYKLNGASVNATPSEIRFNTLANGGLFDVTFGSGLNALQFSFQGAQAFTGTIAAPVFAPGSFALSTWTYSDPTNYDTQTPLAASVNITATPEPAPVSLMLTALAVLSLAATFKSRQIR